MIGTNDLQSMVDLVVSAPSKSSRVTATESLNSCCQNLQLRYGYLDPTPLVQGINGASNEGKISLLSICGGLNHELARKSLREFVSAKDPAIRAAAIRAMCESSDPALLPDSSTWPARKKKRLSPSNDSGVRPAYNTGGIRKQPMRKKFNITKGSSRHSLMSLKGKCFSLDWRKFLTHKLSI